jgi:hypothetical protein
MVTACQEVTWLEAGVAGQGPEYTGPEDPVHRMALRREAVAGGPWV